MHACVYNLYVEGETPLSAKISRSAACMCVLIGMTMCVYKGQHEWAFVCSEREFCMIWMLVTLHDDMEAMVTVTATAGGPCEGIGEGERGGL